MFKLLTFPRTNITHRALSLQKRSLFFHPEKTFLNLFKAVSWKKKPEQNTEDLLNFSQKVPFSLMRKTFHDSNYHQSQGEFLKDTRKKEEAALESFCLGEYDKAMELYKGIYNEIRQGCAPNDPILACYLKKIGDVYFEIKEWDHAYNNYEQSLEILTECFKEEHGELGRCYFLLGMCRAKQGNYAEARTHWETALRIFLKYHRHYLSEICSCYSMLVEGYMSYGIYDEVREYSERLLDVLRKSCTSDNIPEHDDCLMNQYYLNLGVSIAYAKQDYAKALEYLFYYRKTQMAMNGEKSLRVAECDIAVGQVKFLEGKLKDALKVFMETIQRIKDAEKLLGMKSKQMASCYNGIGSVLLEQGDYYEAMESFEKAMDNFADESSLEHAICLRNMGLAMQKQKETDMAVSYLIKSVEERERLFENFPGVDLESGVLSSLIAQNYFDKGDYQAGVKYLSKALATKIKLCVEDVHKKTRK